MVDRPNKNRLVEVAVPLPLFQTFTYLSPSDYTAQLCIGTRVLVPFGKRRLTGYIVGFPATKPSQEIKEICDVLDTEPLFAEEDLRFYQWAATYYCYPLGQTIKAALPQGIHTEYQSAAIITPAGKQHLLNDPSTSQDLSILQELEKGKPCSLQTLKKKCGPQGFTYRIDRLKAMGLIELVLRKQSSSVRVRTEKWFSPVNLHPTKPLKGKQDEIYTYISEHGQVSLACLKQQFGNCTSQLKSLEKKGAVTALEREVFRRPPGKEKVFIEPLHELTPDQTQILRQLACAIDQKKFYPLLLHGVTGSGKTEVYLQVMEKVLQKGRQCLYLVPEIALTAQLWDRISSRLNAPLAMLHSSLTPVERFDAWRMIRRGNIKIVIGARSAIFASFPDLGTIIVDEEHDPSYKQDEHLRYNARDLALLKATFSRCIAILGTATPALESYYNVQKKKYFTGVLSKRVDNKAMPRITIIDMKSEGRSRRAQSGIISRQLHKAIAQRLICGEQSLLFLNRRGFATTFLCQECGHTFTCPNCEVSLIHHKGQKKLCCHYCDFTLPVADECPQCSSFLLASLGWGTERLEREIKNLFPQARTARMDRDTTARRGASRAILKDMYYGDTDILIGTQMIVKGYHLPQVTLVGVICADQSLNFPDYRASERTFQLLTQVAGRAGRGETSGEVFIQTYNPDHYSITTAQRHDYTTFFKTEMKFRKELGYPPYKKIINIRFEGTSKKKVEDYARKFGTLCTVLHERSARSKKIEILGPSRAPWEKIKGRYRYHLLLKGDNMQLLRSFASTVLQQASAGMRGFGVRIIVDVDPLFTM